MTAQNTRSISALIAYFRKQITNYEPLVRDGSAGAEAVRASYGPTLEALQTPSAARSVKDTAAALLYLLDFGNLAPVDEAMLRAAISGLAPELGTQRGAGPLPDHQQDSPLRR
ncbi:MAG: hypothetical protein MO852_07910 [Candidatus Devosia euplotis]|nr:hypothetical protein [Candidatus Devosia euplotis]